jgi:hypothetical protein
LARSCSTGQRAGPIRRTSPPTSAASSRRPSPPPWDGKPRALEDGTVGQGPEIAGTTPEQDQGDGGTPPDTDESLRRFVAAVAVAVGRERDGCWLSGLREYVADAGPLPSSRFL